MPRFAFGQGLLRSLSVADIKKGCADSDNSP
jgi:hypothetical protein